MLTKPQAFYDNTHKQALGYQNPFYLSKAQRIKPTLYDGAVISKTHVAMPVIVNDETLILEKRVDQNYFETRFSPQQEFSAEQAFWFHTFNPTIKPSYSPPVIVDVPSELPKVSLVNASLKKLKFHLTQFNSVVKKRTTPSALKKGEWGSFKDQFDSIKQTRVRHKEQSDSLINKLNLKLKRKEIVENVVHTPSATTIAPGMFKLDLVLLPHRIQELLVYVQDTCPNAITPSAKKVVVTPMNNVKKVRSEVFYY
ncbi:hypothetical protein Tco_0906215 [Tanacetum coccineum]